VNVFKIDLPVAGFPAIDAFPNVMIQVLPEKPHG
jgi:hypothetical protein